MTISNAGGKADRLVKAETSAAMKASLHEPDAMAPGHQDHQMMPH